MLERLETVKLSHLLLEQQLLLFGKIARSSDNTPARQLTFKASSLSLMKYEGKRRRGRPRANWAEKIQDHAIRITGDQANMSQLISDEAKWRLKVREYC